jgi:cytoskeletal protein RodZ
MADGFVRETPGQMLREARAARGYDLDAAHEGTKIPLRLLEAIERDEYHRLSGPLYVRSFLRNYASWLQLDVDAVLRAYESVAGNPEAGGGEDMVWNEEEVVVRKVGGPWRRDVLVIAMAVLVTVLVALGVWRLIMAKGNGVGESALSGRPAAAEHALENAAARRDATAADASPGAPAAERPTTATPPPPAPADASVPFVEGTPDALVLRVLLPAPTNCSVRCDTQPAARPVVWPEQPRPLPSSDLEPGLAYAVAGGYAVYWGASDTFTLTLDETEGAAAMLNGVSLPVADWQPGQLVVLGPHTLDRIGD